MGSFIQDEAHICFRERRVPIEVIRKREIKWLDMFQNWEKWMSKRFKKVSIINEPRHEKTNILVSDLVQHKPGYAVTEDG